MMSRRVFLLVCKEVREAKEVVHYDSWVLLPLVQANTLLPSHTTRLSGLMSSSMLLTATKGGTDKNYYIDLVSCNFLTQLDLWSCWCLQNLFLGGSFCAFKIISEVVGGRVRVVGGWSVCLYCNKTPPPPVPTLQ